MAKAIDMYNQNASNVQHAAAKHAHANIYRSQRGSNVKTGQINPSKKSFVWESVAKAVDPVRRPVFQ